MNLSGTEFVYSFRNGLDFDVCRMLCRSLYSDGCLPQPPSDMVSETLLTDGEVMVVLKGDYIDYSISTSNSIFFLSSGRDDGSVLDDSFLEGRR